MPLKVTEVGLCDPAVSPVGRAPTPSLLALFRVGLKFDFGLMFVCSHLLRVKPWEASMQGWGGGVLINRDAPYIRQSQLCSMLRMIVV